MKTKEESKNVGLSAVGGTDTAALPAVVGRATFQAELDVLRVREKAHTREGGAIAAARRRLPMVEVDPTITLIGPHGPVGIVFNLHRGGDKWAADMDLPSQGVSALPLSSVMVEGAAIGFALPGPGDPHYEGKLSEDGKSISGTFSQGGFSLPLDLKWKSGPWRKCRQPKPRATCKRWRASGAVRWRKGATSSARVSTSSRTPMAGVGRVHELGARYVDQAPGVALTRRISRVHGGDAIHHERVAGRAGLDGADRCRPHAIFIPGRPGLRAAGLVCHSRAVQPFSLAAPEYEIPSGNTSGEITEGPCCEPGGGVGGGALWDLRCRLSGRPTPAWLHDPVIAEASSFNVPLLEAESTFRSIFAVSPVRIMLVTGTLLAPCSTLSNVAVMCAAWRGGGGGSRSRGACTSTRRPDMRQEAASIRSSTCCMAPATATIRGHPWAAPDSSSTISLQQRKRSP